MIEGGKRLNGNIPIKSEEIIVSIVTVVYNDAEYLEQTILSIISQPVNKFEYIIIDGGSTNETIQIIKNYENSIDYWISEKDGGIYNAMNKAIPLCKGKYIHFKNSGDFLTENIFNSIIPLLMKSNLDVLYGNTSKIRSLRPYFTSVIISDVHNLDKNNSVDHRNMFVKKEWLKKFPFDEKYRLCADYDQVLKILHQKAIFYHCGEIITLMNPFGKSFSTQSAYEVYDIQKKYYIFPLPFLRLLRNLVLFYFIKYKKIIFNR